MPRRSRLKLPPLALGAETLGKRIARLRKERGYTQVELAEKIGIIQALVSDYERAKLRPHPEMLIRFAQALEVSTDEILGIEKPRGNGRTLDRRFARRLQQTENLPKRDQQALLRTIDAFLGKGQPSGTR